MLRLLRSLLALALILVVLLLAFQEPLIRWLVIPRAEAALERALGLKATIAGARIDPRGILECGAVDLKGDQPASGVLGGGFESIAIRFSPWRLLRGRADSIEKITARRPRLALDLERRPLLPELGATNPDSGAAMSAASSKAVIPEIELQDADLQVFTSVDSLRLIGVDASFNSKGARVVARGAEGDWKPPRVAALRFPLEVEVAFGDGADPWSQLRVTRLAMEHREYTRDIKIEISSAGAVELSGDLPGWGVRLTRGRIADRVIDLTFHAEDGALRPIVSLFTDWPVPEARGRGDFRLVLPIGHEADWEVETDIELTDLVWPEEELTAETIHAVVSRGGPALLLTGDLLAINASWHGLPPLDLGGSFRRWNAVAAARGGRIEIEGATIHAGGATADFDGILQEAGLEWESAALRSRSFPLDTLARLELLPGSLFGTDGEADLDLRLSGSALQLDTIAGSATIAARGQMLGGRELPWSAHVAARAGSCVVSVDSGAFRSAGDRLRFSGAISPSGRGLPVSIAFGSLAGSISDVQFSAAEPPFVTIDDDDLRLRPTVITAAGGTLSAEAALNFRGQGFASLEGAHLDLARISQIVSELAPATSQALLDAAVVGTASFRVLHSSAAGSADWSPTFDAEATVTQVGLNLGWKRIEGLGGTTRIVASRGELELQELKFQHEGNSIALRSSLPVRWEPLPTPRWGETIEVRIDGDVKDIAAYLPPLDAVRELGGRLVVTGSVHARVQAEPLEVARSLEPSILFSWLEGSFKRADELPPLTDLQADLRLEGRTISIESLTGKIHDAGLRATGEAEIGLPWDPDGFSLRTSDLRLVSEGVLLVRRPDLRVRGDLDLRWQGPGNAPRLYGDIRISRAYYRHDVSLAPSQGVRLPLKLFSFRDPPFDALALGIRIRSDRGLSLRNNVLSTQATLDLLLGGTGREPVLTGTVSTDEGRVRFADSSLKLRTSFLEFRSDDPLNPRLQIQIGDTIRGYVVTLSITGTLQSPEVLLDSSPPLEREKLLVLITTGLTLDEIEERGVGRVAAVKAAKYVGLRVARYFSRGDPTDRSFLDRISLETESARTARQEDPIRVEYRLIERLIRENDELFLQGERDTYGDYNFNVGVRFELD